MHLPNFMARIWAGLITNNAWSVKKSRMVVDETDLWRQQIKHSSDPEGEMLDIRKKALLSICCLASCLWCGVCLFKGKQKRRLSSEVKWSEVNVKAKVLRCKVREGRNNVLIFKSRKQQQQAAAKTRNEQKANIIKSILQNRSLMN